MRVLPVPLGPHESDGLRQHSTSLQAPANREAIDSEGLDRPERAERVGSWFMAKPIEDIARGLVHHVHDHPPVRNLNAEVDRRSGASEHWIEDVIRVCASWPFVAVEAGAVLLWILFNVLPAIRHWDPYPFGMLDLILALEAAFGVLLLVMAHRRATARAQLGAQQDFEVNAKAEEETRAIMDHLESQDEVLLEILGRLERSDRELRRLLRPHEASSEEP